MLKHFTLLIFIYFISNSVSANVFRINSNLVTDANQKLYKTIQEANDANTVVASGDTLMIEGSPIVYDGATLTKRLVLIGTGYFLTENPQTQASGSLSVVQDITVNPEAAGTILMGIQFATGSNSYTPIIKADNVIVMRCNLNYAIQLPGQLNSIQIIQNFFNSSVISLGSTSYTFTGLIFKNNIVNGDITAGSAPSYQRTFSTVENNIFKEDITLSASTFRNNIIVKTTATVNVSSGSIQNNLVSNGQLTGDGNQTYNETQLFVGETSNSTDGQYKLKGDSPYKTAGYNGAEPGIFGGMRAYVLSGLPAIPSIYEFTAENFASKQNGLPINIKVKANQ